MREAFEDADVVHFFMPMMLEQAGVRVAKRMGLPVTAAFHIQPENITYNISPRLQGVDWAANRVYKVLYDFLRLVPLIHCPTEFIKEQLVANGYDKHAEFVAFLRVETGSIRRFQIVVSSLFRGTFDILMVGRPLLKNEPEGSYSCGAALSLRGVTFASSSLGRSGSEDAAEHGKCAAHPPSIHDYSQDELLKLMHSCVILHVHTASVEIEAISLFGGCCNGFSPSHRKFSEVCDSAICAR
ncbi:MAG: hypothetical protein U1U88_000689 [Lawsonella clevelandensis]